MLANYQDVHTAPTALPPFGQGHNRQSSAPATFQSEAPLRSMQGDFYLYLLMTY